MSNSRITIQGLLFSATHWTSNSNSVPTAFICHVGETISIELRYVFSKSKWCITCKQLGFIDNDVIGVDYTKSYTDYDKIIIMAIAMCTTRRYLINREFEAALKERE